MAVVDIVIRAAELRDIEAVQAVRAAGWVETYLTPPNKKHPKPADAHDPSDEQTTEWLRSVVTDPRDSQMFVAEVEGEAVGMIISERAQPVNVIHTFYVSKKLRNKGIGSKLMVAALQFIADDNEKPVLIHMAEHNKKALKYYNRLGFVITNEESANWWGQNKMGEQIIMDLELQSFNASDPLKLLK